MSDSQQNSTTRQSPTINPYNVIPTNLRNAEVSAIAKQVAAAIQPMFTKITNEVKSLRQELKQRIQIKRAITPAQPFKEMEKFSDFEKRLRENEENFASFQKELTMVAKMPNFVKNCWRLLITDELAGNLCWKGTETKKSVRSLITTKAIRNAALPLGITEEQFIKDTKTFFQFAKNRIKLRNDYKTSKKNHTKP